MHPRAAKHVDPARNAVYRRVEKEVRRFPGIRLDGLHTDEMGSRDAAFAHALYDVTLRRWITLRGLIEPHLRGDWRRLDPGVRAALLVGAAQIVFMDKVPTHAAVDESVRWVDARISRNAGGLVNAVLRRVAESIAVDESGATERRDEYSGHRHELPLPDGGSVVLARHDTLPGDTLERLAMATSHPLDLIRTWIKSMPLREVQRLALHGLVRPPTILNTAFYKGADLGGGATVDHAVNNAAVWTGTHDALLTLLQRDDIWVQDPAAAMPVASVSDLQPSLIIDSCAGRGTKTRQLAYSFPSAEIVATDIADDRRRVLTEVFSGSEQVRVVEHAALHEWNGRADLVLIDAPCSNTGVLARRVEARYRFNDKAIDSLINIQRQLIADSIPLLAPRGRILYATCSLDPRENEAHAQWASRWHSLDPSREATHRPQGGIAAPQSEHTDGSFSVLLG